MARRAPLLAVLPACLAAFTNPFEKLAEGGEFEVTWEAVPGGAELVYIAGRVFNDTGDGVTAFQANVSSTLSDRSFTWTNVPYPLPYIPTAHYEIELIPQQLANQSNQSAPSDTIKSPLFSISPSPSSPTPADNNEPLGPAAPEAESSSGPGTNAIIVAVCVSLGIPIFIAAAVCIWWTRRHRRRAKYEESRRRRYDTIID